MLGNLKQLDPIIGLEVVDQHDQQVIQYLESLGLSDLDKEQLVDWGLDRREQGISYHQRGELVEAMEFFQQSRAAFIELYQREGSTKRAQFELGQAEFWVGYVYLDRGDLDEAEESFTRYGAITRRLVNAAPNDAEMVMELSYTLANLGALEMARREPDIDNALRLTQSAVQYNQIALVLDPENEIYRNEMAGTVAWLSDAWLESCNLGKSFDFRQQRVDLTRELYEASPENQGYKLEMAFSLSGLASVQRLIPIQDQALANLQQAYVLLNEIAEQDGNNQKRRMEAIVRAQRMLDIRFWIEPPEELWPEANALRDQMKAFFSQGSSVDYETSIDYGFFLVQLSQIAWLLEKREESERLLDQAITRLFTLVEEEPESRSSRSSFAHAVFVFWERNGILPSKEADLMLNGYLGDPEQVRSCSDASLAARLNIMRGNKNLAKHYTDYLLGRGYYEPGFVAFCRRYELCD
jgi:tetratricopeptide (TPR) repeat protein